MPDMASCPTMAVETFCQGEEFIGSICTQARYQSVPCDDERQNRDHVCEQQLPEARSGPRRESQHQEGYQSGGEQHAEAPAQCLADQTAC